MLDAVVHRLKLTELADNAVAPNNNEAPAEDQPAVEQNGEAVEEVVEEGAECMSSLVGFRA